VECSDVWPFNTTLVPVDKSFITTRAARWDCVCFWMRRSVCVCVLVSSLINAITLDPFEISS